MQSIEVIYVAGVILTLNSALLYNSRAMCRPIPYITEVDS